MKISPIKAKPISRMIDKKKAQQEERNDYITGNTNGYEDVNNHKMPESMYNEALVTKFLLGTPKAYRQGYQQALNDSKQK